MKRLIFYFLQWLAFAIRLFSQRLYMTLTMVAHKSVGVRFAGRPEYIHQDAFLDASGGLTIHEGVVISTKVIILSHDWSFLKRVNWKDIKNLNWGGYKPIIVGKNSFIGAGSILLPGAEIGQHCIVGAGSVVRGKVEDYSVVSGNPAILVGSTNKANRKQS